MVGLYKGVKIPLPLPIGEAKLSSFVEPENQTIILLRLLYPFIGLWVQVPQMMYDLLYDHDHSLSNHLKSRVIMSHIVHRSWQRIGSSLKSSR